MRRALVALLFFDEYATLGADSSDNLPITGTFTSVTYTQTTVTLTTLTTTSVTSTTKSTTTTTTRTRNPDFLRYNSFGDIQHGELSVDDETQMGECSNKFRAPTKPPWSATYYNGLTLNDTCFTNSNSDYNRTEYGNPVFLIGDWGGVNYGAGPVPADHTNTSDPNKRRGMNYAVDKSAQQRVATQFNVHGKIRNPDYVLNVGDNFYWGGITCPCGRPCWSHCETFQFKYIFEWVYKGPGIDGKQWLGVLGNHDYGGWKYDAGWDQAIAYTWGGLKDASMRWMQPSQFYKSRVHYNDFSVDYFFVDTNVNDVRDNPWWDVMHNICSAGHDTPWASCGKQGPSNAWNCHTWFADMWQKQQSWLDRHLRKSIVNGIQWQIVVTHFPPWWGQHQWQWLSWRYGIDLFITGHVHRQDAMAAWRWDNPVKPTATVITGGGGGITSEFWPDNWGNDDQYGFMDMTLWKEKIVIKAISHGGQIRNTITVEQREPDWSPYGSKSENETKARAALGNRSNSTNGTNTSSAFALFVKNATNASMKAGVAPMNPSQVSQQVRLLSV